MLVGLVLTFISLAAPIQLHGIRILPLPHAICGGQEIREKLPDLPGMLPFPKRRHDEHT
jgi:hypothetical protein